MKTTDLISLILYELGEGDKYGFELCKSIENLSNGQIIIKQATLYTILKKLEKSQFITSYWQDSEIGGKRHYYKLTENGNLQLSTMPKIEVVLKQILQSNEELDVAKQPNLKNVEEDKKDFEHSNNSINSEPPVSIMDLLINESSKQEMPLQQTEVENLPLKETIIPTEEVFNSNIIDNLTEHEINSSNATLLHEDAKIGEHFAENKNISKFTENQTYTKLNLTENSNTFNETKILTPVQPKQIEEDKIKFVDYVNFKQTAKYKLANKITKNMWLRLLCSSLYLLAVLAICIFASTKINSTVISNCFLILGFITLVFAPTIFAYNCQKFKIKFLDEKFKFDFKKRTIVAICLLLFITLTTIILNFAIGKSSIIKVLEIKNFSNIYCPILISSVILMDLLFSFLFLKKFKK